MLHKLLLAAIAAGLWAGIALLAGIAWMAFVKPPEPAAPAAPAATIEAAPKPVSAEVFDLRSRCDALSRKVMEDSIADAVLWDDAARRNGQDSYGRDWIEGQYTQKSHYDPATGHCYAQIERSYDPKDGKGKFKPNVKFSLLNSLTRTRANCLRCGLTPTPVRAPVISNLRGRRHYRPSHHP